MTESERVIAVKVIELDGFCDRPEVNPSFLPLERDSHGPSMNVLISGAGIAGPTLTFWLQRYGVTLTLVEQLASPCATIAQCSS